MIIYRTSGAWGSGAGANLAAEQVDGNFYDLDLRIKDVELHPQQPVQITSFTVVGNQMYINMSDGTVQGPLTLPEVRWFFRGDWQPNITYAVDDVFNGPDAAVYVVTFAHRSATAFDANANDGQGHNYYSMILKTPTAVLPAGGNTGYVLTKNTVNNYDVIWAPVPSPPGGQGGQVLTRLSDTAGDTDWDWMRLDDLFDVLLEVNYPIGDGDYLRWSQSAGQWTNQPRAIFNVITASSWAPMVGDEGSFMVLANGTADTSIVIPNDSTQNFAIGSELHVHQDGTGKVTIVGESGVAILKHASFSTQLLGQYGTATVKKSAANTWRLFGLLAGV
jgi:hypothetical protein